MTDQNLIDYLKSSLNQGNSKDQIYKELLTQGWTLKQIDDHYAQIHYETVGKVESQKRTVNIIVTFGAILVGAGVFSFIASNWQGMASVAKVLIIILGMVLVDVLGMYLKDGLKYPRTAEACFLLGSIIYGGGIYLVAQIFNIRANWPDGMLLWLLGTIAMAYALESYSLYFFSVPLGIIAVIGYPMLLFDFYVENTLIYTSTVLLLITAGSTLYMGIHMRNKLPDELKKI